MPPTQNPQQQNAITHTEGPLLIIAGAGTGKTYALVEKIKHLIKEEKAKPNEILALTFTEKAAREMEERVDRALPYGYFQMWISTFHSFADQILKDEISHIGLDPGYRLLTQAQSILFLRNNLFSLNLKYFRPFGNPEKFLYALLQHFSRLRDEYISPEEYVSWVKSLDNTPGSKTNRARYPFTNAFGGTPFRVEMGGSNGVRKSGIKRSKKNNNQALTDQISQEEIDKYHELAHAYQTYQKLKIQHGFMDFDDLMYYLLEVFEQRPSVLDQYKTQFKYFLVDEFQDTNIAQYILIKHLCPPADKPNLTVVGDDSQAIYKFRGASLSNILAFMQDYPDASQVTLNRNYRSYQTILDHSYRLIQNNNPDTLEHRLGISKQLIADRKGTKGDVQFAFHEKVDMEAEYVAQEIIRITKEDKRSFSDCAILVRANNHADPFMTALYRNGIPYRFLGPGSLFKLPEIKDLIAYLNVLHDINDSVSFYRVLSMDLFKMDGKDIAALTSFARKVNISVFEAVDIYCRMEIEDDIPEEFAAYRPHLPILTLFTKGSLRQIVDLVRRHLNMMKSHTAGQILFDFFQESGYIDLFTSERSEKNDRIIKNISSFFDKLKSFESENTDASVPAVVDYIRLALEMGESPHAEEIDMTEYDAVNILTVHSSKGLEFPVVFLPNLTKGRFPTTQRREKLPIPDALVKETLPEGDYHLQEERRLFYVGLTRAQDMVYLSASKFYAGGKRERRVSPFVTETIGEEAFNNTLLLKQEEQDQLSIFDFKPVKEPVVKQKQAKLHTFSYSQLETFQRCPLQYKYQYILKVPTPPSGALAFGESIHTALQHFYEHYQNDPSIGVDTLLQIYEQAWIPVGYASKKEHQMKKKTGREMLKRYVQTFHHPHLSVMGVERNFKIRLDDGIYLTGKMDRVDNKGDGRIEIIDYKTGSKPDDKKLAKNLQFGIYALAATSKGLYNKQASDVTLTFYYLQDMEKVSLTKTTEEIAAVKQNVLETIDTIQTSDFTPKVGLWCDFCPFKMVCEAW
jgi:DNA helicase-2/ATP-dependent DNA helicase PcrA